MLDDGRESRKPGLRSLTITRSAWARVNERIAELEARVAALESVAKESDRG